MNNYIEVDYFKKNKTENIRLIVTTKKLDAKSRISMKKVCCDAGFTFENLTSNVQIHSDIVNVVDRSNIGEKRKGDALITNLKNVPLLIFTADCVPISIIDEKNNAIGIAHSGWKGTYSMITKKTINKMKEDYKSNPQDLICVIGPSIGQCCYEISSDLSDKFKKKFTGICDNISCVRGDSVFLNLWDINKSILIKSGVNCKNIYNMNICTSCNYDKFFSYRKDNKTSGRIGTLLEIK